MPTLAASSQSLTTRVTIAAISMMSINLTLRVRDKTIMILMNGEKKSATMDIARTLILQRWAGTIKSAPITAARMSGLTFAMVELGQTAKAINASIAVPVI